MGRPKVKTSIRRRQIAEAVLEVVSQHGSAGLSVARVAGTVGFVPSAIYRHFRNKDQMLDAVLELIRNRLLENVRLAGACPGALDALHDLLLRHAEFLRQSPAVPRIVFSDGICGEDASRRQQVRQIMLDYAGAIAGLVGEGQQRGEIRRDADPQIAAMMFIGLIQPGAILWQATGGRFDLQAHLAGAWLLYRDGLLPPNGTAPATAARKRTRRRIP